MNPRLAQGGMFSVALSLSRFAPAARANPRPSGEAGRWALPTTAVQRCSDFPPVPVVRDERPSTHPAVKDYTTKARGAAREIRPVE